MPSAERPPLPLGLDLLWGRREPGRRGPRPSLSVARIVAAAIAIADRDGLGGVSMARVAAELGVTAMSLYHHVASKDALLQLMWNNSAQGVDRLVIEGDGWRERLRNWSVVQWDMLERHPWITQMPVAAPPLGPNALTFVERGLETLDGTGLSGADKMRTISLLSSYALSEARMAHDAARLLSQTERAAGAAPAASGPAGATPPAAGPAAPETTATETTPATTASFEALLRELVDERNYPRLHGIAWSHEAGEQDADHRDEFLYGLDRILDGIQVLIERRGAREGADPVG
jgi:AcrR family transcriptional regulator